MKKWMKQYGIHIVICAVIFVIAFGINQKINLDRSHMYTVSDGVHSILKGVTKAEINGSQLELAGWIFDTEIYNESSSCELILQDTETDEAVWPKMEKNPKTVEIAKCYTDGRDYSGTSFGGSIKANQLNEENVYEILVRYTIKYVDENGIEQKYIRTISTDEYIYQGELIEYNPKTFMAPEIAGTELEKELEGARMFYYFEEGMWIYFIEGRLFYIIDNILLPDDEQIFCPMHWYINDINKLPEVNQQYGFGNSDFDPKSEKNLYSINGKYTVAYVELPSEYITHIETGICSREKGWVLKMKKQLDIR